jgi:hypothetical protein
VEVEGDTVEEGVVEVLLWELVEVGEVTQPMELVIIIMLVQMLPMVIFK